MNLVVKIAKFCLSKSIFYVENHPNFFVFKIRSTTFINDTCCLLNHVMLKSWLTWKAFSCSPWQTTPGGVVYFWFWLVSALWNGFEEIWKCLKIKLKTDSISLQVVTFLKSKIKCVISRVNSQVISLWYWPIFLPFCTTK